MTGLHIKVVKSLPHAQYVEYSSFGNFNIKAIENLVHILDPKNDGVIHFEDFKKAFQSPTGS